MKTFISLLLFVPCLLMAKLPELQPSDVTEKLQEIMEAHVYYKEMSPMLMGRVLKNYLEELDPVKTYFLKPEIEPWLDPSEETLNQVLSQYQQGNFDTFYQIRDVLVQAIERRHRLEEQIATVELPEKVKYADFQKMDWLETEEELLTRLAKIRAMQVDATTKLSPDLKDKALQLIKKRQKKVEGNALNDDPDHVRNAVLSYFMKSAAAALDSHTVYFTPEEAKQFLISVQSRLFGIGAALRDDLNGFSIIKIIDGGPASRGGELQLKDRVIAVNGEPVVGMEITDAVQLIRGEEDTQVVLTVVRQVDEEEKTLHITITRGEVVLKEARFESSVEPFGDGVVAYLRLFTFYQDPDHSSAGDITKELNRLKKEYNIKGVVLDLRDNTGGLLAQAVAVTGLFISRGVVVSIKDADGNVQHLRDIDGETIWNGPLIVMVNRASASASEIVSQTLQDYGRALIVGDDHSYGKGSFQTFTLNTEQENDVNPKGEYTVTRGLYYTVAGHSPQLNGVQADVVVPSVLSQSDIGERFTKYPIESESIPDSFDDKLEDIPFFQRQRIKPLYLVHLQKREQPYQPYLELLKSNSEKRIANNKNYQSFLAQIKKVETTGEEEPLKFGQNDLQLAETMNVMKDLILLSQFKESDS
ncbi:MAG: PDZ domain-containing protein [Chlamydiia bacterium]|nr:PDZ domain-containing protein [Chlamydiia bacterium]